nr:uncharacterized abhydrolase domain-containing protein DDB_G0269086-like [Aegilops tauschii subsp. strangulata]
MSNAWARPAPGSVLSTGQRSGASFSGCSGSGDMAGVEELSGTTARGRKGRRGKGESGQWLTAELWGRAGRRRRSGSTVRHRCLKTQLTEMLVSAPYQAPKKKGKEGKSGPRHKGSSDAMSGETEAPSSHEGDKEEEEEVESDSPCKGMKKKRAASKDPKGEAPKRGKMILQDSSNFDAELVSKKPPLAKTLPRDLPNPSLSEGSSLPPEMAKSETPPCAPSPLTADGTEVLSQRTSPGCGGASEAIEKAPEDMVEATPMATNGGDRQQSRPQPYTLPETNVAPGLSKQLPSKEGGGSAPSATSTNPEAPNTLVEALQCASIMEEHRTLKGAVVEKASLLVATAQAAEVSELNWKLKLADEEIDRVNKRFDDTQVGAAEVQTLKGALAQAQKEAKANKAAAEKAAAELRTEQAARRQHKAQVAEVEQELKEAILKCEGLEQKASAKSSKLAKALQDAKAARVESRSAREEIHQAKQIAAGSASSASDSQNISEQHEDLSEGSSPAKSFDEGSRITPTNLPKAAKTTRKTKGSGTDEDFQPEEVTSKKKKKKVLAKEYGTSASTRPSGSAKERLVVRKVLISKADKATAPKGTMTFTLEDPSDAEAGAGKKKKRPRKTIAHVIGKPSMVADDHDDEEEEEPTADAPPAKTQKLMTDVVKSVAPSKPKSKPKALAPKRSTRNC